MLPLIKEWKVSDLWLGWNHHPQIIKDVQEMNFPRLTSLYIYDNDIETVEELNRIWIPQLETLHLSMMSSIKVITL